MRRAVVSYYVNSTDREKIKALREGIQECIGELVELGVEMPSIEEMLDEALGYAEFILRTSA